MRVVPISPKAKKIMAERMGNHPQVKVQQRQGGKVLFSSVRGAFCAWIDLAKDPDWLLVISD